MKDFRKPQAVAETVPSSFKVEIWVEIGWSCFAQLRGKSTVWSTGQSLD